MILLQTLSRLHVCATLVMAQMLGSVIAIIARLSAPNKSGPGGVFPNPSIWDVNGTGENNPLAEWAFWVALICQIIIVIGYFVFFRKEQLVSLILSSQKPYQSLTLKHLCNPSEQTISLSSVFLHFLCPTFFLRFYESINLSSSDTTVHAWQQKNFRAWFNIQTSFISSQRLTYRSFDTSVLIALHDYTNEQFSRFIFVHTHAPRRFAYQRIFTRDTLYPASTCWEGYDRLLDDIHDCMT